MPNVAVGIMCKTPAPGKSKTRLSPPLHPTECASISACFIRDLAHTIDELVSAGGVTGYAVYTPVGSEATLRRLLPANFELLSQVDGDFGARLFYGVRGLLDAGHDGVILVNSDSPTLPLSILRDAVDAVRSGDNVVLSRAADGGYTLIGLSRPHRHLFEDIVWSTSTVYQRTRDRAAEIGIAVLDVPPWYDVDDAVSLRMLEDELAGYPPPFSKLNGADAPSTRRFLRERHAALVDPAA
ncbi:MAG TPA: TIGR04282 family arsenosugar biosynthesis glycosyltransferase [Reyranella sp.]|nr:TIGR04282 family arsenosugar biosynthesis glycosyltransferase [Reyranella sp.]